MSILPVGGVNCNYNKNIICLHVTRQQRFHSLLSTVGIPGIRYVPVLAIFAPFLPVLPNFFSEVEYLNLMCIMSQMSATASPQPADPRVLSAVQWVAGQWCLHRVFLRDLNQSGIVRSCLVQLLLCSYFSQIFHTCSTVL